MQPPRKPRQDEGPKPPLRQLKEASEANREWAYGLRDQMTSEAARGEIREKMGISLGTDKAYGLFCQWMWRQKEIAEQNASQEDFESWYSARNPGASREKIREMGIAFFMAQAMKDNDPKTFYNMSDLSLAENKGVLDVKKYELEREKLAQKIKDDIAKGLDALYEEVKANPAALELFKQFKAVIAKATEVAQ
jgi:hypothetical protein